MQKNTTQWAPLMSRGRKSWNYTMSLSCSSAISQLSHSHPGESRCKAAYKCPQPFSKDEEKMKRKSFACAHSQVLFYYYSLRSGNREVKALQFWGGSTSSKFALCYLKQWGLEISLFNLQIKNLRKAEGNLGKNKTPWLYFECFKIKQNKITHKPPEFSFGGK